MPHHPQATGGPVLDRRELLRRCGMGLGLIGLAGLCDGQGEAATTDLSPLAPKRPPHFPGKARACVVHLFMNGGPSQVDTFDPKPMLDKYHGRPLPNPNLRTERKTGAAMGSPFKFRKYGESGIEVSELFAKTAECVDDLCVIRSMVADVPNHEPSLLLMNCGDGRLARPSMGAWITYGLGSENQNLPGFVAMCPGGYPIVATQNWRSSFLPGAYQGTYIDTKHTDIRKLIENIRNDSATPAEQRRQLDLVGRLNDQHWREHQRDRRLEARIQSFELAYRMQSEASDAFDSEKEPELIRGLYGPGMAARQLIIARRLLERGVRFVQVLERRRPGLGHPREERTLSSHPRRKLGPADLGIPDRPETAGDARRDARHLGRRVRPDAGRRAPRPERLRDHQPLWLHHVDGGRRREGGHRRRCPRTSSASRPWRTGPCPRPPRHNPSPARVRS